MPPDIVARAFDPFFTTKPTGQGTGLGLSMIYGFAEQSGGQARIYSEVGARAPPSKLYLPRYRGNVAARSTSPHAGGRARRAGRDGETVLIVDDEATVRILVRRYPRRTRLPGHRGGDASVGALRCLESDVRRSISLITDVGLPGSGLNGRQMADAARRKRAGAESPVHHRLCRERRCLERPPRTGHAGAQQALLYGLTGAHGLLRIAVAGTEALTLPLPPAAHRRAPDGSAIAFHAADAGSSAFLTLRKRASGPNRCVIPGRPEGSTQDMTPACNHAHRGRGFRAHAARAPVMTAGGSSVSNAAGPHSIDERTAGRRCHRLRGRMRLPARSGAAPATRYIGCMDVVPSFASCRPSARRPTRNGAHCRSYPALSGSLRRARTSCARATGRTSSASCWRASPAATRSCLRANARSCHSISRATSPICKACFCPRWIMASAPWSQPGSRRFRIRRCAGSSTTIHASRICCGATRSSTPRSSGSGWSASGGAAPMPASPT